MKECRALARVRNVTAGSGLALRVSITRQEVIAKILTHVKVPREPVANDDAPALFYDVAGEPVPAWVLGGSRSQRTRHPGGLRRGGSSCSGYVAEAEVEIGPGCAATGAAGPK